MGKKIFSITMGGINTEYELNFNKYKLSIERNLTKYFKKKDINLSFTENEYVLTVLNELVLTIDNESIIYIANENNLFRFTKSGLPFITIEKDGFYINIPLYIKDKDYISFYKLDQLLIYQNMSIQDIFKERYLDNQLMIDTFPLYKNDIFDIIDMELKKSLPTENSYMIGE